MSSHGCVLLSRHRRHRVATGEGVELVVGLGLGLVVVLALGHEAEHDEDDERDGAGRDQLACGRSSPSLSRLIARIVPTATIHTSDAGISTFQPNFMNWS